LAQIQDDIAKLKEAVAGLTYPSESDEPFEVVRWENPGRVDVAGWVGEHGGKGRKVKQVGISDFFEALRETDDAERYELLRRTFQDVARDVKVFRVGDGEVSVDVYVLGNSRTDGSVVGVHTVSVET
jgi:hypothetical protein